MGRSLTIDKNMMEIRQHGTAEFPFRAGHEALLEYANKTFDCHWHNEIEFMRVITGQMLCRVNEEEILLRAGDSLFVNQNVLHMGWAVEDDQPCIYTGITLNASILDPGGRKVKKRYLDPLLSCKGLPCQVFRHEEGWQGEASRLIGEIDTLYHQQAECFEMEIVSRLMRVWSLLYQNTRERLAAGGSGNITSAKLKSILLYIQENYMNKIYLEDISTAAGLSKSGCDHLFKSHMKESPFEYLLRYRIEKSLPLLTEEDLNVTETSLSVGFSSASYYTKIFKAYLGVTPKQYRKQKTMPQ